MQEMVAGHFMWPKSMSFANKSSWNLQAMPRGQNGLGASWKSQNMPRGQSNVGSNRHCTLRSPHRRKNTHASPNFLSNFSLPNLCMCLCVRVFARLFNCVFVWSFVCWGVCLVLCSCLSLFVWSVVFMCMFVCVFGVWAVCACVFVCLYMLFYVWNFLRLLGRCVYVCCVVLLASACFLCDRVCKCCCVIVGLFVCFFICLAATGCVYWWTCWNV